MRNLSMKKFGTPIGAAPGSASDVVGLASVGTPSALRSADALSSLSFLTLPRRSSAAFVPVVCAEALCCGTHSTSTVSGLDSELLAPARSFCLGFFFARGT